MTRRPLPADVDFQAIDVPTVHKMLADAGVKIRKGHSLTLDELHAAITNNIRPEDRELAEQIIVVSKQDGVHLNQAIIYGLHKLRPDRDASAGFNALTMRSKAITMIGVGAVGLSLTDLDVALSTKSGEDHIVLDDQDYRNLMTGINEIISGVEHGRSPKYD